MNKLRCFIILFFTCGVCKAQNLVPNGDFEQYSGCPDDYAQFDSLLFWLNITDSVYYYGSPDYFNQCSGASNVGVPLNIFGFQQAHSGVAYSGIVLKNILTFANYREYMEVPLSSALIAGNCYHFEMFMSLSDLYGLTTDDIGVYFSDTLFSHVNNYFPLPVTPQISNAQGNFPDTVNWTVVSGNYTAAGGENYLLIGNFLNDSNTNTITANTNAQYNGVYVYIDDVSLTPCTGIEEQNDSETINIYPNPVTDKLTITVNRNELTEVNLYDVTSGKIFNQSFTNSISINTAQLAKGIYFYEVRTINGPDSYRVVKKGKVVKD